MKYFLLIILVLTCFLVFGEFKIIEEDNTGISIEFIPDDTTGSKAIVIPAYSTYSVKTQPPYIKKHAISKDAYIGDNRIIILKAIDIPYSAIISFDNANWSGRLSANPLRNVLSQYILNNKYIDKFAKPREKIQIKSSITGEPIVKFYINQKGIYRIYFNEIQANTSTNISGIDVSRIQLYNNGNEIPLYIGGAEDGTFDSGDYIEFVGDRKYGKQTYIDRYSLYNIYILYINGNPAARYISYNESFNDTIDYSINEFTRTYHIEYDSVYERFRDINADTNDFWFYKLMRESDSLYNEYIKFNYNTSSFINMRIMFHGLSRLPSISPDHPIDIYINDSIIASINWNDQVPYLFEQNNINIYNIEDSLKLSFHVKYISGDTSIADTTIQNTVLLNWIELDYRRELKTDSNFINFRIDDDYGYGIFEISVSGFTTNKVIIYRNNVKRIENYISEFDSLTNTYTIRFTDRVFSNSREYSVYSSGTLLSPVLIDTFRYVNLSSTSNMGKTILIIDQKYKENIEDLKTYFEDNEIFITGTDEIYNEFSYGFVSPHGIRNFIKTAYNNWSIPPTHILLIGDASKDDNNHFGYKKIYIPSTYIYRIPAFGTTASDYFYSRIVGDDYLSDISVARFPAENEKDINTLKSKIINYIDYRNQGTYVLRAIMAYDTFEYVESKYHSENIAALLPSYMYPDYMHTFEDWSTDFLYELNQGASLLNILSHGANTQVGYGPFLRIYDILQLNNLNRLPFVSVYSCNTNEYNMLYENQISIGEAFVLAPSGGGIAYYGATAVSEKLKNYNLAKCIYKQIVRRNIKNIGELERIGEIDYFFNSSGIDPYNPYDPNIMQIMNYVLIGVNFLDLPVPDLSSRSLELSLEALSPKDTLIITLNDTLFDNGTMETILLDNKYKPIVFNNSQIFNGNGQNTLIIPDSVEIGSLIAITIAYSEDTSVMYISYPSIGNVGLQAFGLLPESPDTNETYKIYAIIRNNKQLKSVYALGNKYSTANFYVYNMIQDSIDSTLYYTDVELTPLQAENKGYNYYYKIQLIDSSDNIYNSITKTFFVRPLPDLMIDTMQISVISENRKPFLETKFYNPEDYVLNNIVLNYKYYNTDTFALGNDTLNISKLYESSEISIDSSYLLKNLLIELDPDNIIRESNENNNIFVKKDFNWLIIPFNNNARDTIVEYEKISINIMPDAYNIGSFIAFHRQKLDSVPFIKEYIYNDEDYAYQYMILNGDTNTLNVELTFVNDSVDEKLNLFTYNNDGEIQLISKDANDTVDVELRIGENIFIIGTFDDTIKPDIDIVIENKDYINNVILSTQCKLSVIIEDNTGINKDNIIISLNNDTLPKDEYTIFSQEEYGSVSVKVNKELEDGLYEFIVSAEDIFGNSNINMLNFRITTELAITQIGSFPNPAMGNDVEFACRLTENADDLKLFIYNANGTLIDRVEFGPVMSGVNHCNYNLINIPNGTYFYYFQATKDNTLYKSKIEKMSVLR